LNLNTFSKRLLVSVVEVTYIVLGVIVNHDALVEGMETEGAIVPLFGLLVQVPSIETSVFMYGRSILGGSHN